MALIRRLNGAARNQCGARAAAPIRHPPAARRPPAGRTPASTKRRAWGSFRRPRRRRRRRRRAWRGLRASCSHRKHPLEVGATLRAGGRRPSAHSHCPARPGGAERQSAPSITSHARERPQSALSPTSNLIWGRAFATRQPPPAASRRPAPAALKLARKEPHQRDAAAAADGQRVGGPKTIGPRQAAHE